MAIFEDTEGRPVAVSTGAGASPAASESVISADSASLSSTKSTFHDASGILEESRHTESLDKAGHTTTMDSTETIYPNGFREARAITDDGQGHRTASLATTVEVGHEKNTNEFESFSVARPLAANEKTVNLSATLDNEIRAALQHPLDSMPPYAPDSARHEKGITFGESHSIEFRSPGAIDASRVDNESRTIDGEGHEHRGFNSSSSERMRADGKNIVQAHMLHQDDNGNRSTFVSEVVSSLDHGQQLSSVHTEGTSFHDTNLAGKWAMPLEAHRIGTELHAAMPQSQVAYVENMGAVKTQVPETTQYAHERHDSGALPTHTFDSIVGYLTDKAGYAAGEAREMVSGISDYLGKALNEHAPGEGGALEFHKSGAEAVTLNSTAGGATASHDGQTASLPMDQLKAVHESGMVQDLAARESSHNAGAVMEMSR